MMGKALDEKISEIFSQTKGVYKGVFFLKITSKPI